MAPGSDTLRFFLVLLGLALKSTIIFSFYFLTPLVSLTLKFFCECDFFIFKLGDYFCGDSTFFKNKFDIGSLTMLFLIFFYYFIYSGFFNAPRSYTFLLLMLCLYYYESCYNFDIMSVRCYG